MSKFVNQLWRFVVLFAYIVGSIGGFGCAMYNRSYLIAVCVLAVVALAFPEAKRVFKGIR